MSYCEPSLSKLALSTFNRSIHGHTPMYMYLLLPPLICGGYMIFMIGYMIFMIGYVVFTRGSGFSFPSMGMGQLPHTHTGKRKAWDRGYLPFSYMIFMRSYVVFMCYSQDVMCYVSYIAILCNNCIWERKPPKCQIKWPPSFFYFCAL